MYTIKVRPNQLKELARQLRNVHLQLQEIDTKIRLSLLTLSSTSSHLVSKSRDDISRAQNLLDQQIEQLLVLAQFLEKKARDFEMADAEPLFIAIHEALKRALEALELVRLKPRVPWQFPGYPIFPRPLPVYPGPLPVLPLPKLPDWSGPFQATPYIRPHALPDDFMKSAKVQQ